MARECMKQQQIDFSKSIDKLINGLDNIYPEISLAQKEEVLISKCLELMNLDKSAIELVLQLQSLNLTGILDKGIFTGRSTNSNLSFRNTPLPNGNYKTTLTKTTDLINLDYNSKQIFQSKKKMIYNKIVNSTGFLPQSPDVFTVMHLSEGNRLTEDFICPSLDGGEIIVLGVRPKFMDVAVGNSEPYKKVGIPPTLFLLRLTREVASDEFGTSNEVFKITTAYTVCVKSTDSRLGPNTPIYHSPFSNVNISGHGHVCLGKMKNSHLVTFHSLTALDRWPYNFFAGGSSSHDYGTNFTTFKSMDDYARKCSEKEFPPVEKELKQANYDLSGWIINCINHMMGGR